MVQVPSNSDTPGFRVMVLCSGNPRSDSYALSWGKRCVRGSLPTWLFVLLGGPWPSIRMSYPMIGWLGFRDWSHTLALPLRSCVGSGKSLYLSEPPFPRLPCVHGHASLLGVMAGS